MRDIPSYFIIFKAPKAIIEPLNAQGQPYKGYKAIEEPILEQPHEGYLPLLYEAILAPLAPLNAFRSSDAAAFKGNNNPPLYKAKSSDAAAF